MFASIALERAKLESSLILKAVEAPNETERRERLAFLVKSRLIRDAHVQAVLEDTMATVPAFAVRTDVDSASAIDDTKREERNAEQLKGLYPRFRTKIMDLLDQMETLGMRPYILSGWRSPEEQGRLATRGVASGEWSMHSAKGPGGRPEALAVDIVDANAPWRFDPPFYIALAVLARERHLDTGILWGLSEEDSLAVERAIQRRDVNAPGLRIGRDPRTCFHWGFRQPLRGVARVP